MPLRGVRSFAAARRGWLGVFRVIRACERPTQRDLATGRALAHGRSVRLQAPREKAKLAAACDSATLLPPARNGPPGRL